MSRGSFLRGRRYAVEVGEERRHVLRRAALTMRGSMARTAARYFGQAPAALLGQVGGPGAAVVGGAGTGDRFRFLPAPRTTSPDRRVAKKRAGEIAPQVRDVDAAADFRQRHLRLRRAAVSPAPHAPASVWRSGSGASDRHEHHDRRTAAGIRIFAPMKDGSFGPRSPSRGRRGTRSPHTEGAAAPGR
ncbi:hypothetical protein [Marinactinospora rubrisoli]|uniref:Uncharacterized protein n=1 Tax=Marinactinospora rubrisoli TaxID=2715399 RepID=A0ABW2KL87_9ACTN